VTPARGEVWRYSPVVPRPGQSTLRLVVSSDGINRVEELPVVLALHIVDNDPGGLLAVAVPPYGWATALTIEPVMRSRLSERLDVVDSATLDNVSAALRAAQDL
jgi:mRNA-degrading endonuclease toxin of MazEF toxin-antitoxin module